MAVCSSPRRSFGVDLFFNVLRHFASQRVGFVSTLPITLRLGVTHARLIGLRAVNSCLPAVVLSVTFVSLPSCLLCLVYLPRVSR